MEESDCEQYSKTNNAFDVQVLEPALLEHWMVCLPSFGKVG